MLRDPVCAEPHCFNYGYCAADAPEPLPFLKISVIDFGDGIIQSAAQVHNGVQWAVNAGSISGIGDDFAQHDLTWN